LMSLNVGMWCIDRVSSASDKITVGMVIECWCGGWASNPRRPTPTGLKPVVKPKSGDSLTIRVEESILDEGFFNYCITRASRRTCEEYVRRLREIAGGRDYRDTRWTRTAYKLYLRFLCETGSDEACSEYKRVKLKPSKPDTYIPGDEEIREALSSELGSFYSLLVQSGLRVDEVIRVLETRDLDIVRLDGFVRVRLDWWRGQKKAFWGYFLDEPRIDTPLVGIYKKRERLGLIPFKYARKWMATQLLRLGCQGLVVDFIQGRVERNVLARNYANLLVLGDECYARYASWLRGWLQG